MTRQSTKRKILEHGAHIVYQKGFNNTGIQEVLQAAGVPKGSFYFYFKSKEEFGLELIDVYRELFQQMSELHLDATGPSPLKKLQSLFEAFRVLSEQTQCKCGCPIGNLTQEMGGISEVFRVKLKQVFQEMTERLARTIDLAQQEQEIDPSLDANETAAFILNSWEGALTRMKAEGTTDPLLTFDKMVFERVLRE